MISRPRQLIGREFGLLKVRHYAGTRGSHKYWCCVCACLPTCIDCKGSGCTVKVRGTKLLTGKQISCGCSRTDSRKRTEAALKVPVKTRVARARSGGKCRVHAPYYSLSLSRASDLMNLHPDKILELSRAGVIRTVLRKTGSVKASATDVLAWIEAQQRKSKACPESL